MRIDTGQEFQHSHSVPAHTFRQGGLVGLFLLCAVLFVGIQRASKTPDTRHAVAGAGLLYAVSVTAFDGGTLIVRLGHLWVVVWLPVALAWAASHKTEQ